MTKISVIVEGYAREENGAEFASATTTLIRDRETNIIVDPGMDRGALLAGLDRENLTPEQIQFVIQTHTHNDHALLAGIFSNADILDNDAIYSWNGKIAPHAGKVPRTEIEIIGTPGHDQFHCSVLVPTEDLGRVVIAGDVIWWYATEEQKSDRTSLLEHPDPYVKDPVALRASREKILSLADYIIPGHGKMFRVEK